MEPITDSRTVGSAQEHKPDVTNVNMNVQGQTEVLMKAAAPTGSFTKCHVILCLVAWQQLPGGRQVQSPSPGVMEGRWSTSEAPATAARLPFTASGSFFKIRACDCNNPAVNNWSAVLLAVKKKRLQIETPAGEKETSHPFTSTEEEFSSSSSLQFSWHVHLVWDC